MSSELIKFGARTTVERVVIGNVAETIGPKGSIKFIKKNLKGTKRVYVTLVNEKGLEADVTCSKEVSAGVRDKSINIGNLMSFDIFESKAFQRDANGEQMFDEETGEQLFVPVAQIQMPDGEDNVIEIKAKDVKVVEYAAPLESDELFAF